MNPERKEILALPCLPGRLTPAETAWRLASSRIIFPFWSTSAC